MVENNLRDKVQAGWDWNNDDVVDEWTDLSYIREFETFHIFENSGYYSVKYIGKDQWGVISEWTYPISFLADFAPEKTQLSGPNELNILEEGSFSTVARDPEGDNIYYQWKIDGIPTDWEGPYESEQEVNLKYSFKTLKDHTIIARAKDTYNVIGEWSNPLTITVSRVKSRLFNFFDILNIEKFPILIKIKQAIE
jgi:hypothetical protein